MKIAVLARRLAYPLPAGILSRSVVMLALVVPLAAQTTWYVDASAPGPGTGTQASPFTSIQSGIAAAANADTILVLPGTYVETIDFLGRDVIVRSHQGPALTVIDGNKSGTVVTFDSGEGPAAVLEGFTVTNGLGATGVPGSSGNTTGGPGSPGGIACVNASPTIRDCLITMNQGGGGGAGHGFEADGGPGGAGGVQCDASTATLNDCRVTINRGGGGGRNDAFGGKGTGGLGGAGGIGCFDAPVQLDSCYISSNHGGGGGAGTGSLSSGAGGVGGAGGVACIEAPVQLDDCDILNNVGGAGARGYLDDILGLSFLYGAADSGPGGIWGEGSSSDLILRRCTITGNVGGANKREGGVGGVHCADGNLLFDQCTISGNTGGAGAGSSYANKGGHLGGHGGLYLAQGQATLLSCRVSGNLGGAGGAGYCQPVFGINTPGATGGVGGLNLVGITANISGCLISGNTGGDGSSSSQCLGPNGGNEGGVGGMRCQSSATTLVSTTIYGNRGGSGGSGTPAGAQGTGGVGNLSDSTLAMTNGIVWGNSPTAIKGSGGGTVTYSDIEGGFAGLGNLATDPLLADPNNGDYHLTGTSPCIDAGNRLAPGMPAFDLDGDPRVLGGAVDMGSDEFVPPPTTYCTAKVTSCLTVPEIGYAGAPSATAASGFRINAVYTKAGKFGLLLHSPNGRANNPFSGGYLCISAQGLRRSVAVGDTVGTTGQCDGLLSIDMNAFAHGALGGNPQAFLLTVGQQVNCQFWGRDTLSNGALLTDALEYFVGL